MCLPACQRKLTEYLSRRSFIGSAAGLGLGGSRTLAAAGQEASALPAPATFRRVIDLTHTLSAEFPSFGGTPQFSREPALTLAKDGFNASRWMVFEHVGTHFDAPLHISDGASSDQIPAADLVGPLAVVDIRAKAESNPDAELTPDDLKVWESAHGTLPRGAIVAMRSGWDAHVATPKFRNADDRGQLHFPGVHVETVELLLEQHEVKGIAVDTLSLDRGTSARFPTHLKWLPAGKWGLECVANLGDVPESGAILIAGAPKVAGASGGPSRVLALV